MSASCAAIGVDLGTRRVGLAGADPTGHRDPPAHPGTPPPPLLDRAGAGLHGAGVPAPGGGPPRRLDGGEGPAAGAARSFAADAEQRLGLEVAMWDEWLTTAQAERVLIEGGVRRADRRSTVDAVAATLILQSYLDAHRRKASP